MENSLFSGTEGNLSKMGFPTQTEKTQVDKLMAKEELKAIESLIEKETLSVSELRKLGHAINAMEIKLVSFTVKTRHILGKYTVWLQDAIEIQTTFLMNKEILATKKTTPLTKVALAQTEQINHSTLKKLICIYLFFLRSSLSLDTRAFEAFTTNRVDYEYRQRFSEPTTPEQKGTTFNFGRKNQ